MIWIKLSLDGQRCRLSESVNPHTEDVEDEQKRGTGDRNDLGALCHVFCPPPCLREILLTRSIHGLAGWNKESTIWWAGACELTCHFDWMVF